MSQLSRETVQAVEDEESRRVAVEDLEKPEPLEGTSAFPDGGVRAWLTVFGAFMINFCCYGVISSFGVFQEYYRVNQLKDQTASSISWIGSLQLCLILLVGCVSGPLFDAGYLKALLASGTTLYVFCLFMTSISTEYYQFVLSQGLGVGLAMGLLFSPSLSTIPHHFQKYKVPALGVFACGASVGGTVLPLAMRRLFVEIGFAWAVRILAFLVLFCTTTGFFCCSTRLPPRKGTRVLDFRVFKDPAYALLVLGASLVGLGLYAPISFGVSYATDHGVSPDLAFYSLSMLNAGSFFGRLTPNLLAPKFGSINTLMACCLVAALLDYLWTMARSIPEILVFNISFGFFSGGYVSVLPASVASLSPGTNDIGLRLGMAFFSTSFFWLASSPTQGALIRLHNTYMPASVFAGSAVLCGVVVMAGARYLTARKFGAFWV